MGQRQSFTGDFKDRITARILSRGNRSIAEICEEEGIGKSTAANWLRLRAKPFSMKKEKKSHKWDPEKKFKVLLETASLSESELGAYLRKEGLFSTQLDEWKNEFLSSMATIRKSKPAKDDRDQKIRSLEKEILRKDKALAEASALLILQKKVNLIWGRDNEDEK